MTAPDGLQAGRRFGQMTIPVTADIIKEAIRRNPSGCMISDAVKAKIPNVAFISSDLATIRFTIKTTRTRYVFFTPPRVARALIAFDQGETIQPFEFRLRSPAQISQMRTKTNRSNSPKAKLHPIGDGTKVKVGGAPLPNTTLMHGLGRIRQYGKKWAKE